MAKTIEFKRLTEINKTAIIDLMNNQLVRQQMPLLKDTFREDDYYKFIASKELLWIEHGYGPWAFIVNGRFAGWGGLQYENGEADLALVLDPNYWGIGKQLFKRILAKAFEEMGLSSITALLPPTRLRVKGLLRLGFLEDGEVKVGNERFIRYRLRSSA